MNTRKKRILGFFLLMLVFVTSIFADKSFYYADETSDSGVVGEVQWKIEDETLTFSAAENTSGKMKDYSKDVNGESAPWILSEEADSIKNIVIEDSITELGKNIFETQRTLESVKIPGSVKEIPEGFIKTGAINLVEIADGVEIIRSGAFCAQVYEVTIPESVQTIGLYAFSVSRDVADTYLLKVNGYDGSVAENYVDAINFYVSDSRQNGAVFDGLVFKRLVWSDAQNDYIDDGEITFSSLGTADAEKAYYEFRMNQQKLTNITCTNSGDDVERKVEYIKNDKSLQDISYTFGMLYPEDNLISFELILMKNGIQIGNENCVIKIEIPSEWKNYADEVKVLTLISSGSEEVPTDMEYKLVTENNKAYLTFETGESGSYALYLDHDGEMDEEDTETEDTEDTETEDTETEDTEAEDEEDSDTEESDSEDDELDDTPKTGLGFEPVAIAIICLALVGIGILLIAKYK